MFGRNKKDPGPMIEAQAIITNVEDTGTTVNENPRVKLTMQVQPDGAQPFEVTKKVTVSRVRIPKMCDPIRVKYYANHPEGLAVQKRTTEDLAAAAAPVLVPVAAVDPLDRIKKLNELRQAGAVTDAEFEAQKAKILG
jgi:hypothetical protein